MKRSHCRTFDGGAETLVNSLVSQVGWGRQVARFLSDMGLERLGMVLVNVVWSMSQKEGEL